MLSSMGGTCPSRSPYSPFAGVTRKKTRDGLLRRKLLAMTEGVKVCVNYATRYGKFYAYQSAWVISNRPYSPCATIIQLYIP